MRGWKLLSIFFLFLNQPWVFGFSASSPSSLSYSNKHRRSWIAQTIKDNGGDDGSFDSASRRGLLWKVPLGAVVAYSYGTLAYTAFSVQGISYPDAHERRVRSTIEQAVVASARQGGSDDSTCFRILEVGMGNNCRVARRGLYEPALLQLQQQARYQTVRLVGLDLRAPSQQVLEDARQRLNIMNTKNDIVNKDASLPVDLQFIQGSIDDPDNLFSSTNLPPFDCIVCCFTLCSVEDPVSVCRAMKQRLRPDGGTFGFVEHVAVAKDDAEPYLRFLDWQQRQLDPIQQAVADNCHLHRASDQTIAAVFEDDATWLTKERFLVNNMWPISMQSCGVLQRRQFRAV